MIQSYPLRSLTEGSWFKLICGASYQHLPAVRSLALAYSLAGADCIDVAADPAVIATAREGIKIAQELANLNRSLFTRKVNDCQILPSTHSLKEKRIDYPWLMVSINDGEDPHFRKAEFDTTQCPTNCPQPCVKICPANAIELNSAGVITDLCYGCGRCLPVCPEELIVTRSHISSPQAIASLIKSMDIDALEIHTQVGHYQDFKQVWQVLYPVIDKLKLLAISCTDGQNVVDYLRSLYELISPLPCPLIWQTDGRSMSGDIGKGTTHAAISFANKVIQADLPGYIQLAGGTNDHTVEKLKRSQMLQVSQNNQVNSIAGVAYGSYARAILSPTLDQLETTKLDNIQSNLFKNQPMNEINLKLEQNQDLLQQAVSIASQLVNQIKQDA